MLRCCLAALLAAIMLAIQPVSAQPTISITTYHDGESCPGSCDAHVVFHSRHNGTANAFAPSSSATEPRRCAVNEECRICFDGSPASCMTAVYRGGGPPPTKFDVTPAFLDAHCGQPGIPSTLSAYCRNLDRVAARFAGRGYCLMEEADARCQAVRARAQERYDLDRPIYERCLSMGEAAFNRTQPPARQRSLACAYERNGTGQNSRGVTWRKLLPGACPTPTFVGANGLDCCTSNLRSSLAFGVSECAGFILPRG